MHSVSNLKSLPQSLQSARRFAVRLPDNLRRRIVLQRVKSVHGTGRAKQSASQSSPSRASGIERRAKGEWTYSALLRRRSTVLRLAIALLGVALLRVALLLLGVAAVLLLVAVVVLKCRTQARRVSTLLTSASETELCGRGWLTLADIVRVRVVQEG